MSDHTPPPIFPWLEANGALIALVATLVALVVPFVISRLFTPGLRQEVADRASWPDLIARYNLTGAQGYYRTINRVLYFANRLYGLRRISRRAFGRSLQLAFVYPVLALLLGWLLFDAGTLGGVDFLPEGQPWSERLWRFGVLILAFAIAASSFRFAVYIERVVRRLLTQRLENHPPRTGFLSKPVRWVPDVAGLLAFAFTFAAAFAGVVAGVVAVAGAGAGVVAVAVAVSFAGAVAVAVTGAGAFAFAVVFAFAGVVAVAVAVVFAFAGVVAVVFAVVFAENAEITTVFLLFFILLPWLNALADFISVAATRHFLTHIRRHRPGVLRVLWDVALDLIVAALCLLGLLGALWGVLLLWEALAPATLVFDWRGYWSDILQGNWQKGMVLLLMVLTTLIPTALHLLLGLAGFWAQESRAMARAVAALQSPPANELPVSWANNVTRNIRRGIFWGWFKALLALGLLVGMIWGLGVLVVSIMA